MIQAITFDFWCTLFLDDVESKRIWNEGRFRVLRDFLRGWGSDLSRREFERLVDRATQRFESSWFEMTPFGARDWLQGMLEDLGLPTRKNFSLLVREFENIGTRFPPALVPGALETIPKLAERYRLAIISDTAISPGRILRTYLQRAGVLQYFEVLTFSDEIGYTKPHPECFLRTLGQLGVSASEAVHVGDLNRTDVAGALAAGMKAIRFAGVRSNASDPDNVPVVAHFEELPRWIEALADTALSDVGR